MQLGRPSTHYPEWVDLLYLPKLFIAAQANGVSVSWEAGWTNVVLEAVPMAGVIWSPLPVAPTNDGNQLAVFVTITNERPADASRSAHSYPFWLGGIWVFWLFL